MMGTSRMGRKVKGGRGRRGATLLSVVLVVACLLGVYWPLGARAMENVEGALSGPDSELALSGPDRELALAPVTLTFSPGWKSVTGPL